MPETTVPAHAKINLALEVLGRRDDGFHDIDTIIVPIDWNDSLVIGIDPSNSTEIVLEISGPSGPAVPTGVENLAHKAAVLVAGLLGRAVRITIRLRKEIPPGSGMGGGSSDAAAVLIAAGRLAPDLGAELADHELYEAACRLGSDVPAALADRPCHVRGRGERIEVARVPGLDIVVAVAGRSGTGPVYAAVDHFTDGARVEALAATLAAGHFPDDAAMGSDLEAAAAVVHPDLAVALARLRAAVGDRTWHLTGSGGAAFAVVDGRSAAEETAAQVLAAGFPARACRSIANGEH